MLAVGFLIIGGINKEQDPYLPLRTNGCDFANNTSPIPAVSFLKSTEQVDTNKPISWIFRINFQYFCIIGLIINITVSYIGSILTGGNTKVDQKLLATFIRKKSLHKTTPLLNDP